MRGWWYTATGDRGLDLLHTAYRGHQTHGPSKTLGPLISYDKRNDMGLVESVRVFLRNDGVWQTSATTKHRTGRHWSTALKKVEQLTGLKPATTEGSAFLSGWH